MPKTLIWEQGLFLGSANGHRESVFSYSLVGGFKPWSPPAHAASSVLPQLCYSERYTSRPSFPFFLSEVPPPPGHLQHQFLSFSHLCSYVLKSTSQNPSACHSALTPLSPSLQEETWLRAPTASRTENRWSLWISEAVCIVLSHFCFGDKTLILALPLISYLFSGKTLDFFFFNTWIF